jgi:hypothetical protein
MSWHEEDELAVPLQHAAHQLGYKTVEFNRVGQLYLRAGLLTG